jgi:hypothetical protein
VPDLPPLELVLDAGDVLLAQGGDPGAVRSCSPAFAHRAERAPAEAVPLLQPRVSYQRLAGERLTHERMALAGRAILNGPLVALHLASASDVVVRASPSPLQL